MSAFEHAEYQQRLARTRLGMAAKEFDLLLVTTPENINYLCGYAGWSFYTPQALLVSLNAPEPLLIVREMDVACARFTTTLSAASMIGYPETYIGGNSHPMEYVAKLIAERFGAPQRVGFEPAGCFFPVASFERLQQPLPDAQFVDSQGLINWLRTVKSSAEVNVIREAAALASAAIATAREHIRVGARECDVAAEIYRTLIGGDSRFGGSVPAAFSLTSGERTAAPHIAWTDHRFQAGQAVNLELGGSRHQYNAGLARSFFLGSPPPALRQLSATVIDGLNAALASARPGQTCEGVAAAWQAVISRAGYTKTSRIGYSIGLGFQPTWIDYSASLQKGDKTVLEPNMTFHMICGMWHGADNFVISETFRVTEEGHEVLTNAPRELIVLD